MCLERPLRGLRVMEEGWPGKFRKEAKLERGRESLAAP